jgi:RHS repeat-associated protein
VIPRRQSVDTFGPSGLLSRQAGSTGPSNTTLYTFDPRGNVSQRLSQSGSILSTDVYNAYGKLLSGNPSGDEFGFGGQAGYRTDQETGLCLLGERYYDPSAERFLTRDPAGYGGGMDLYAYAGDNPVSNMDPSGLCDDGDPACVDLGGPNTPGFAMEHATLGDDSQAGLDFASAIVHAVPGVGTVFNGSDAVSGCDVVSGRPVSTGGRFFAGAMAVLSLIPGAGLESRAGESAGGKIFYLVDHNIPQFNSVSRMLRGMGYNAQSVMERYGVSTLEDGRDMGSELTTAFGDNWFVITRDLDEMNTPRGWPMGKIIHIYGGNTVKRAKDVMDILVTRYGF